MFCGSEYFKFNININGSSQRIFFFVVFKVKDLPSHCFLKPRSGYILTPEKHSNFKQGQALNYKTLKDNVAVDSFFQTPYIFSLLL